MSSGDKHWDVKMSEYNKPERAMDKPTPPDQRERFDAYLRTLDQGPIPKDCFALRTALWKAFLAGAGRGDSRE